MYARRSRAVARPVASCARLAVVALSGAVSRCRSMGGFTPMLMLPHVTSTPTTPVVVAEDAQMLDAQSKPKKSMKITGGYGYYS